MNDERDEEERSKRPRPRIIDKRVSARSAETSSPPPPTESETSGPAEATQAPPEPPRAPEPPPGAPEPPPRAPEPPPGPPAQAQRPTEAPAPPQTTEQDDQVWTPEQEAQAQQMAKEIVERPSEDWVLNVAVTLANVAGAKLDMGLAEDAGLAIDAFESLVNGIGSRLEGAEAPLRQTLAQLQVAYAQTVTGPSAAP